MRTVKCPVSVNTFPISERKSDILGKVTSLISLHLLRQRNSGWNRIGPFSEVLGASHTIQPPSLTVGFPLAYWRCLVLDLDFLGSRRLILIEIEILHPFPASDLADTRFHANWKQLFTVLPKGYPQQLLQAFEEVCHHTLHASKYFEICKDGIQHVPRHFVKSPRKIVCE